MELEPWVKMSKFEDEFTLGDFLEILHERERDDDAASYLLNFFMVAVLHDVDPDDILSMTMNDLVNLKNKPPQGPPGWNTYWGKSVVRVDGKRRSIRPMD